jgi:hypothetical protein
VDEATFVLCDDAVRRVAHFTCDLLMSLVGYALKVIGLCV